MRLLLFTFLLSALSFGQDRNGISYQALIINPNVEQLPGQDNDHSPLTNTDICLQFHIINSSGVYEYSESQSVTTDAYGMVNLVIGTGLPIGAITWDAVAWSAEAKSLKVDLDITGACTSFTELSNQQLTSVPFALYSPASNTPGPKGDPGDPGADGDSAYQVWLDEGNTGTEQDFLDSLKGTDGTPGDPGADGDSAYQVWLDAGNTGTEQEFLESLKGADGDPGEGTEGKSAYDIWIELGNTGTEQDFIDSLVGPQGEPGQNGSSNISASPLFYSEIEEKQTIVTLNSCESEDNDLSGMIAPPGSGWTTNAALNFSSCWRTPNGSYKGGCESSQQWTAPLNCRIEPKTPLPSIVEHFYDNINSSKVVITPPKGEDSFEISMKIEFMNLDGDLISSFVDHSYVANYRISDYYTSKTSHEFLLNTINPRINNSYPTHREFNELIFQLSENAVSLKITFEAIAPENPPSDYYVLIEPTYNSSGGTVSYNWIQQEFLYNIFVWR